MVITVAPQPESAATAPAKGPSVAYLMGALAGGNIASAILRAVGGILQARLVSPSVLGLFNGIGLVLGYSRFLHLGILNGLNRELPYAFGKGDHQQVRELAAAAQAWAILLGSTVGLVLFGVSIWHLIHGDPWLAAGWATNAIQVFILFYGTHYLQCTYRTTHDFARLSLINVAMNVVALALVSLVALLNFYGLCLRAILTSLVSTALLFYWRPIRIGPKWSLARLKHLLIIGLPIFAVGELGAFWPTLDGTLVLRYLGDHGMGLYAMVLVAGGTLELIPLAVGQVLYPRMAEHYGRTHRRADLIAMSVKPMTLAAIMMVPAILVGWWLADPVTRFLVPKYVDAIPAMRWSLLAPLVGCFLPINNIYNVVRRQDLYSVAIVLGMASYLVMLMWLLRSDVSLVAFPKAMFFGRIILAISSYLLLIPLVRKPEAK